MEAFSIERAASWQHQVRSTWRAAERDSIVTETACCSLKGSPSFLPAFSHARSSHVRRRTPYPAAKCVHDFCHNPEEALLLNSSHVPTLFRSSAARSHRNSAPALRRSGASLGTRVWRKVRVGAGGDGPTEEERALSQELEAFYESLDLEYESVWDTKPAWCQPWTILLTGTLGITGSWQLLHVPVVTGVVTGLVGLWWFVFLLAYPQSYKEMIAERREYQQRLASENGRPLSRE